MRGLYWHAQWTELSTADRGDFSAKSPIPYKVNKGSKILQPSLGLDILVVDEMRSWRWWKKNQLRWRGVDATRGTQWLDIWKLNVSLQGKFSSGVMEVHRRRESLSVTSMNRFPWFWKLTRLRFYIIKWEIKECGWSLCNINATLCKICTETSVNGFNNNKTVGNKVPHSYMNCQLFSSKWLWYQMSNAWVL